MTSIALKLDVLVRSFDVCFRGLAGGLFESHYKILIGFVCCKTIPNALAPKFLMTMARDYVANSSLLQCHQRTCGVRAITA